MRCHLPVCLFLRAWRRAVILKARSVPAVSPIGSFSSSMAAISHATPLSSWSAACRIILAIRGWQGRAAMRLPSVVMQPFSSMAPSVSSRLCALTMLPWGGIVSHGRAFMSFSPNAAMSSSIGARSASSISGFRCSAIRCSEALVHSL